MAKKRRKSVKYPDPIDTLLDIAGAVALGAITRRKIIKDYQRGEGEESVKAAMMVHGTGALRRGSNGIISLGGVYGINSALKEIERQESKPSTHYYDVKPDIPITPVTVKNNRYAWRLNCEDGSKYGISPHDYEAKAEYNAALNYARSGNPVESQQIKETAEREEKPVILAPTDVYCLCRVSRLDNGQNTYYLTGKKYSIGSQVKIPTDGGFAMGVVLSYEEHSLQTLPVPLDKLQRILEEE